MKILSCSLLPVLNLTLFSIIITIIYNCYQPAEGQLRQQSIDRLHPHAFDYYDPMSSPDLIRYIHHQLNTDGNEIANFMLHPIFDEYREVFVENDEVIDAYRRRLQFGGGGFPTLPPTEPPSVPFKDVADIADQQARTDLPYILVDFGAHISYESGNKWCRDNLGTTLATVDKYNTDRLSQVDQIQAMEEQCFNVTSGPEIDCWIGLRWDNSTNRFQWENGQRIAPNPGTLIPPDTTVSITNFGPDGSDPDEFGDGATPTASSIGFQVSFCIV